MFTIYCEKKHNRLEHAKYNPIFWGVRGDVKKIHTEEHKTRRYMSNINNG